MNISIFEAWVVYYTAASLSPALAVDVIFTTKEEAEAVIVECQQEDADATIIFPGSDFKYYVCTVDEWVRVKSFYERVQGEHTGWKWNDS